MSVLKKKVQKEYLIYTTLCQLFAVHNFSVAVY